MHPFRIGSQLAWILGEIKMRKKRKNIQEKLDHVLAVLIRSTGPFALDGKAYKISEIESS